ncbi:MAG: radical SAM protein [Candidatus Woesearchaeota archaeon]
MKKDEKGKEKLDCLLISPPSWYKEEDNIWKEVNSNFPPLGLADLAGFIRAKGFSIKILDCDIYAPSVESFRPLFIKEFFSKFSDIRVIGLTTLTCNIKKVYKLAEICKEFFPEAKVTVGGVHATFSTDEVIKNKNIDIAVIGEGEITLAEILDKKNLEDIDGIMFKKRKGGKIFSFRTKPRQRIMNLDEMPMPAYDLLPILKYQPAKGSYKKLPAMSMMTSRGCPGRCTFCSKTLGTLMFFKSAEKIFEDIQYLIKNYGIRQIQFYDDTFTVNRQNVMKLCDLLLENKVDISWTCFARVDYVDFEMLQKMKSAGCHQIMYGVENIDENVLRNINKKTNVEQVLNANKWTKKAGIESRLAFMVGNPGDNKEIIMKNVKFVNKLNPDLLIVNITTPFPGTAMFEWAKNKNLILTYDWDDYTLAKPVMRLEDLSADDIKELYKLMYRKFYFRPGYVIRKIAKIRSIDDVKILLSGVNALFSFFKPGNKQEPGRVFEGEEEKAVCVT